MGEEEAEEEDEGGGRREEGVIGEGAYATEWDDRKQEYSATCSGFETGGDDRLIMAGSGCTDIVEYSHTHSHAWHRLPVAAPTLKLWFFGQDLREDIPPEHLPLIDGQAYEGVEGVIWEAAITATRSCRMLKADNHDIAIYHDVDYQHIA